MFLQWHRYTGFPKLRGNVILFHDEQQFYDLLMTGKPVVVAFTTSYLGSSELLKKQFRLCAPHFPGVAHFVEVDCGLTPTFCNDASFVNLPSVDVFHLSHREQLRQTKNLQKNNKNDKNDKNYKNDKNDDDDGGDRFISPKMYRPKLYRFDYSWSRYGFQKFFEDYGLLLDTDSGRDGGSGGSGVWGNMYDNFVEEQRQYYEQTRRGQGQGRGGRKE